MPTRAGAIVKDLGSEAAFIAGESNEDEAVTEAIEAGAQSLGQFSIAVSATGVVIRSPHLVEADGTVVSKDILLANLDLHVVGPFNLARLSASAFRTNDPDVDSQRGVIVQTASISAFDGQAKMVPYASPKGHCLDDPPPMARDLAPIGVRVCAPISPGAFLTPRLASASVQTLLLEDVVFPKRLGRPEEYALLVEAIVRNPYLNGETIRLDGATRLGPEMGWRGRF